MIPLSDGEIDAVPSSPPSGPRIVHDDDTLGGAARIAGTRVRVSDIVIAANYHDLAPDEIADEYPTVSVPGIHAALAYFNEHPQEIREEIREREQAFKTGE